MNTEAVRQLPADIRRPGYDRSQLPIGLAHIGVGAFHRCHQAEYTDDMLSMQFGPWGIVGVNLRPPRLSESFIPQDCLYTRTLRKGAVTETRLIGCIRRVIDVDSADAAEAAVSALAAPEVGTITLTLTEKGYCHTPATGALNPANEDIRHDHMMPSQPKTALGLLARVFERRMALRSGPVTVVSCDNLPSNGQLLGRVLSEFLTDRPAPLRNWTRDCVAFPSTMVDRIVPATSAEDLDGIAARLGYEDRAAVVGEPFRQWVIEDTFTATRPPWAIAGAQLVTNVAPYELIKMRILNAAQSTLSHLGALLGHEFSYQAATDPVLARFVRRMLSEESARTVPNLADMPVSPYIDMSFLRIENTAIKHRCHQIGTDGSQKIVQRLVNPLRELAETQRPAPLLTLSVAAWLVYVLAGARAFGHRWDPIDPFAAEVMALADVPGADLPDLARRITGIAAIFGTPPALPDWHAVIAGHLVGLLSSDPRRYLASVAPP